MRSLRCPTTPAKEILELCIQSIRDNELTGRLKLIIPLVESAEQTYIRMAKLASLHTIAGTDSVGGHVSTEEMKRVYKQTFVRSAHTRDIYDAIKKLPENDICPLCGQRTVSTLDHYLPQCNHPSLTVTLANLIPACFDCNKIKLKMEADIADDQTLHPYFDLIDDERWLFAQVQEQKPASLIFTVNPPDGPMRERVIKHFRVFELARLYASHAAVEVNDIRFGLERMLRSGSSHEIRTHLLEAAETRARAHSNSWRRATYEALADSEWFCNGGFLP
jgi:hypothetical protein